MAEADTGVEIERATVADVADVVAFIRALAEYERLAHEVTATEASLRESLFGPRPGAEVVFAKVAGERVGFAVFFHNFSTFVGRAGIYLEDLFVKPEHRGHGVGQALLSHVARIAVERGCGRFEWAVLDWNSPAIGFYKKLGAVPMDDWTVFRLAGPAIERLAAESKGKRTKEGS